VRVCFFFSIAFNTSTAATGSLVPEKKKKKTKTDTSSASYSCIHCLE
jgi:hypothetical protein